MCLSTSLPTLLHCMHIYTGLDLHLYVLALALSLFSSFMILSFRIKNRQILNQFSNKYYFISAQSVQNDIFAYFCK